VPYFPDVPGRESFTGEQHHTGLWPATPVDFAGKRVAVIGTGSSGVQIITIIAEQAASLTVYQRTANWCTPLNNRPITAEEQAKLRAEFESMRDVVATSVSGFPAPSSTSRPRGFRNFYFPGGPHAAAGNNPRYNNGDQVDFVTNLMVYARDNGYETVEVDPAAEADWTAMIDRAATKAPSFGECSYYFGTNIPGKPRKYLLNSAGRPKLLSMIAEITKADYKPFIFAG
jgi:hypothetical protein